MSGFGNKSSDTCEHNFNNSNKFPKSWFSFVRLFLWYSHGLPGYLELKHDSNSIMRKFSNLTRSILRKEYGGMTNQYLCPLAGKTCYCGGNTTERTEVSAPVGRLTTKHPNSSCLQERPSQFHVCRTSPCRTKMSHKIIWTFHLSRTVSLNLTTHQLYFPLTQGCTSGKLDIMDKNNRINNIVYCGQHSNFDIYADFSHIKISTTFMRCRHHIFKASFSLFDRGLIWSMNRKADDLNQTTTGQYLSVPSQEKKSQSQLILGFVTNEGIIGFVWHFQCKKLHRIIFSVAALNHVKHFVFDSPEKSAKILSPINGMFFCSTFQCLLQVHSCLNKKFQVPFSEEELPGIASKKLHNLSQKVLHLPEETSHGNVFALCLQAPIELQVNATAVDTVYTGKESYECKFGGFTAVERNEKYYRETVTVCENHDGNTSQSQSQSFYSQNSSLILLLYWYEDLAEIKVTFSVSLMKCFVVWINLCFKEVKGAKLSLHGGAATLTTGHGIPKSNLHGGCLVLNYFALSNKSAVGEICRTHLSYSPTFVDVKTKLTVKGSLVENNYLTECSHGCHQLYGFKNYIHITAIINKFCNFFAKQKKACKTRLANSTCVETISLGNGENDLFTEAHVFPKKSLELFPDRSNGFFWFTFRMWVNLWKNSKTWLQVQIDTTQLEKKVLTSLPAQIWVSFQIFAEAQ